MLLLRPEIQHWAVARIDSTPGVVLYWRPVRRGHTVNSFRPIVLIAQAGLLMAASLGISLVAGLWIDAAFSTKPLGILLLTLLGTVAGSVGIYGLVSRAVERAVNSPPEEEDRNG